MFIPLHLMKNILDIDGMAKRYNLDSKLKEELIRFGKFIWQDCEINSIQDLVTFEKKYNDFSTDFEFCYDEKWKCFEPVDMEDGNLSLLNKKFFQHISTITDRWCHVFSEAGLSELESAVMLSFLADISGLYRLDAYPYAVPPFVSGICKVLNRAIEKMPIYTEPVVRACHKYDKCDFKTGQIFIPGYCLTCSADVTWENKNKNRYVVYPLDSSHTKARAIYKISYSTEKQVSFLIDAKFKVIDIKDWGEGNKQIEFVEIL